MENNRKKSEKTVHVCELWCWVWLERKTMNERLCMCVQKGACVCGDVWCVVLNVYYEPKLSEMAFM